RLGLRLFRRLIEHQPPPEGRLAQNFGRKRPLGEAVKISSPSSVTPIECSHCDDSDLSRVTAVQPSDSTFTAGLPRFTIGSTVKTMLGFSAAPSPPRP